MKQLIGGLLVVCVLAMLFAAFQSSPSNTLAQDDAAGSQASEIADLQTRVADLETAVAGGGESDGGDSVTRPALSLTPAAAGGTILFEENQEAGTGFSEWTEGYFGGFSNQFTVEDGMLVAEAGLWTVLYAPYLTTTPDYIVEVEMRQPLPDATPVAGSPVPINSTIAGLVARYWNASWEEQGGYEAYTSGATYTYLESPGDEVITPVTRNLLGPGLPDPTDGEWHTYRLEVRGDTVRFLIDGVLIIEATGVQYQGIGEEGRVGVLVSRGPVDIRAFRVIAWGE